MNYESHIHNILYPQKDILKQFILIKKTLGMNILSFMPTFLGIICHVCILKVLVLMNF